MPAEMSHVEIAAGQLCLVARNDDSEPPQWRTAERLLALEEDLVHRKGRSDIFLDICKIAGRDTGISNATSTLFLLGVAGVQQLQDTAEAREQAIWNLAMAKEYIGRLVPCSRQSYLWRLWRHHSAGLAHDEGRYREALGLQEQAANQAAASGDESAEVIDRFLTAWETFCHAACQTAHFDAATNLTGPLYEILTPQYDKLTRVLTRTGEYGRWLKFEAPSRLLAACVLVKELKSVVTSRALIALRNHLADETIGQRALDGWRLFTLALAKLMDAGQVPGEKTTVVPRCLAAVEATEGADQLVNALAKLSLGRYHCLAGNKALAAACYRRVLDMPPTGLHMLQALADKEFKTML